MPPSALGQTAISPRFSPNPLELRGTGGGNVSLQDIVGQADTATGPCTGYANAKPDHTLVVNAFFNSLSLRVQSSEDTSLAIKGPGGIWCNDDEQGKNPGISGQWLPGTYSIWIGSYNKNGSPKYTLRIQENR
jgi:hypothetical protein